MTLNDIERRLDHDYDVISHHSSNGIIEFVKRGGFFKSEVLLARIRRRSSPQWFDRHFEKHYDDSEVREIKRLITQYYRQRK